MTDSELAQRITIAESASASHWAELLPETVVPPHELVDATRIAEFIAIYGKNRIALLHAIATTYKRVPTLIEVTGLVRAHIDESRATHIAHAERLMADTSHIHPLFESFCEQVWSPELCMQHVRAVTHSDVLMQLGKSARIKFLANNVILDILLKMHHA
jgi:hypothetical protein